jgi:hypothetical protein
MNLLDTRLTKGHLRGGTMGSFLHFWMNPNGQKI